MTRETVRKAPIGAELRPQKSTKGGEKALFAALGAKKGGSQRLLQPLFGRFLSAAR